MPITGQLRQLTIRQLLDEFADLEARDLAQLLEALRTQVGLEVLPALSAVLQVQRQEWDDHLRSGRAFGAHQFEGAAVGLFSLHGLFNPAASGIRVLVWWAQAQANASEYVNWRIHNAELGAAAAAADFGNLLAGGAAAVAHVRDGTSATLPGTRVQARFSNSLPQEWKAGGGYLVELPPGFGLYAFPQAANVTLVSNFMWAEVPE